MLPVETDRCDAHQPGHFGCQASCVYQRMVFRLIVVAQFLLAGAMVLTLRNPFASMWASGLLFAGIALSLWSMWALGRRNLSVGPLVRDDATLVGQGPYRWIRHPMYAGLMLFTAAFAVSDRSWTGWQLWLGLAVVVWIKSRYEERLLSRRFPGYAAYQRRTGGFVPRVSRGDRHERPADR